MAETYRAIALDTLFGKVIDNLNKRIRRSIEIFSMELAATDRRDEQTDIVLLTMIGMAWRIAAAAGLSRETFLAHVEEQLAVMEAHDA